MAPVAAEDVYRRPHLVFIPYKDKGHIAPAMILANKLAILHGISITMIFASRQELESAPPAESPHIRFVSLDTQGGARTKAAALHDTLESLSASAAPPVAVLVDIIVMWSTEVIRRSQIPKFVLYTASCSNLSVMMGIREAPPEAWVDESRVAQQPDLDDPEMPDFTTHDWRDDVKDARGVLVNSCQELERAAMAELTDRPELPVILPVGPLLAMDEDVKTPDAATWACKQWLDDQQPSSVIFVCFGSRTYLLEEQIRELADGLEQSKRPFLWIIHPPPHWQGKSSKEYLNSVLRPQGFMSRNQSGMIMTGWAPQRVILQHPSLLGFVTHCGWNSILECLYAGAKPMLCWPFGADQPQNTRFVVDDIRAGVELEKDPVGAVRSSEIQAKIMEAAVMADQNSDHVMKLTRCLKECQTSSVNLRTFAHTVSNL